MWGWESSPAAPTPVHGKAPVLLPTTEWDPRTPTARKQLSSLRGEISYLKEYFRNKHLEYWRKVSVKGIPSLLFHFLCILLYWETLITSHCWNTMYSERHLIFSNWSVSFFLCNACEYFCVDVHPVTLVISVDTWGDLFSFLYLSVLLELFMIHVSFLIHSKLITWLWFILVK